VTLDQIEDIADGPPPDGSVSDQHISETAGINESKLSLASDAAPEVPSRRTLGTGEFQAAPGDTVVVPGVDVAPLEESEDTISGYVVPSDYLPDTSVAGAPVDNTTKPLPLGIPAAGHGTDSSPQNHVHPRPGSVDPSANGCIAWTYDPIAADGNTAPTAGTLYLMRVWIPTDAALTGIALYFVGAPAGLTNCHTILVDAATRNTVASSSDLSATWGTTAGNKTGDFSSQYTPTPGYHYAGFWIGGASTMPTLGRKIITSFHAVNLNTSGNSSRCATGGTGFTSTVPSSVTLTASNAAYLMGVY
jgi:hypothetical protein